MLLNSDPLKSWKPLQPILEKVGDSLRRPLKLTKPTMPWPLFVGIIMVGLSLTSMIFSLLAYQIYFLNRTHIGIYADDIDVSMMTYDEVHGIVSQQADRLVQRPITLVHGGQTWRLTAAELGARVDIEQTVGRILEIGRSGNFLDDLKSQLSTGQHPIHVAPLITFDSGPSHAQLKSIAGSINRPIRNAELSVNDDLTTDVTWPEAGQTLDIEATREEIRRAIVLRGDGTIPVRVTFTQPAITEVQPTLSNIERLLNQPVAFVYEDQRWILEPSTLADFISFDTDIAPNGKGRIISQLNRAPLATYFHNLALDINQEPKNAWFDLDEATWTLQPIIESQSRIRLDVAAAVDMTANLLYQPGQHTLTLPVMVEAPTISLEKAEHLGIRELVSTSTSYFAGSSAERMQNIAVSASKFHGLVIPPDGMFSFNKHLGDVSEENGFVESLIIRGDRTAVGIGGGVCQVSTTAFRAAFDGGFEIVERWAHGYRVSWYETGSGPGLDATIYSPHVDLKFRNDTNSYMLIQTNTDLKRGTVTFNFYGTKPDRKVYISEPVETNHVRHDKPIYEEDPSMKPGEMKQVDWAKDGMDVAVQRTVMEGDTVLHQDTIFSQYQAWQAVYKVGPGFKSDENR